MIPCYAVYAYDRRIFDIKGIEGNANKLDANIFAFFLREWVTGTG